MTEEPIWIRDDVVSALHERQIAEHGGILGVRDRSLLESALNSPKHRFHYENADVVELAATLGFSLAMNHPFVDGNKRCAYICMRLFLKLNGMELVADKEAKIRIMLDLAGGKIDRFELTAWLQAHVTPL